MVAINKRNQFQISDVIDTFAESNKQLIINDGNKDTLGTAIPYLYNLYSDLIVNPCSISISEFQKMVTTQPIIASGLTILNNLVKNEIGQYQHNNQAYSDFINNMLINMNRPLDRIIDNILTALPYGFFVGEKIEEIEGRYKVLKDVEPRPPQSIIFRVDSQGHLKEDGIIQYYFNNLWTGYGNMLSFNAIGTNGQQYPNPYASYGDLDYPLRTVWAQPIGTVIIPKKKCVHFAYQGVAGMESPYGIPITRPAYDYYLLATEMNKIMRNGANYKASPIPAVIVDPNQANVPTPNGSTVFDEIYKALATLGDTGKDSPFLLLQGTPQSIVLDKLDSTVNLTDLVALRKYFDQMMLTSILYPSELAGLSDKGSYALGKTQQDLQGRTISSITSQVKDVLIKQMIAPILQENFNEQQDFGSFELVDNVAEDVALNINKIQMLTSMGIKLTDSAIMSMLDLEEEAIESTGNPIPDFGGQSMQEFKRDRNASQS